MRQMMIEKRNFAFKTGLFPNNLLCAIKLFDPIEFLNHHPNSFKIVERRLQICAA